MVPIVIAFVLGVLSGFIGAVTGGGGLISIPGLIFLGLPPQVAIATTKVGSLGLASASLFSFHKKRKINYNIGIPIAVIAFVGAAGGATILLNISTELLEKIVAVLLIAVLVLVLSNKDLGIEPRKGQHDNFLRTIGYALFLFIGFWASFFAAGWAIVANYTLASFFKRTFLESAAIGAVVGIGVAIISVFIFAVGGVINWPLGISLLLGMAMGSYAGVSYGIRKGNAWVRGLLIIVVVVSVFKLLFL